MKYEGLLIPTLVANQPSCIPSEEINIVQRENESTLKNTSPYKIIYKCANTVVTITHIAIKGIKRKNL